MRRIAYVRISTKKQRYDRQLLGLKALCDELHMETVSARAMRRPVYDKVVSRLEPGDMLVVWDLDRAFRSVVDARLEIDKLRARGVNLEVVKLSIDTTTPTGVFFYTMRAALAELESLTLSQRTKEGLAAARKRGQRLGRPPVLTEPQLHEARWRIETSGMSMASVARAMGVPHWTLSRSLRRLR